MSEWTGTRHCPTCDSIELATGIVDDKGRIHTWCLNCNHLLRKYDENGTIEWEDPDWVASQRPDLPS